MTEDGAKRQPASGPLPGKGNPPKRRRRSSRSPEEEARALQELFASAEDGIRNLYGDVHAHGEGGHHLQEMAKLRIKAAKRQERLHALREVVDIARGARGVLGGTGAGLVLSEVVRLVLG